MKKLKYQFPQYLMAHEIGCTVFLTNGVKLSGVITDVDGDALFLHRDDITQLVMMRAIATIMPSVSVDMDCIRDMHTGE